MKIYAGMLAVCLCASAIPADAQQMPWSDKGFLSVNGGVQAGSHDLTSTQTFPLYDETATVTSSQTIKSGGFFDVGAGYKVWHDVAFGVAYSWTSNKSDVALSGSIPDPIFFDSHRPFTASATGAKHTESALHLDAVWMHPVTNKISVDVSAGPTIFFVKQDLATAVTVSENPFAIQTPTLTTESKTTAGFNFGADVTYLIGPKWGVGGLARYTYGKATLAGQKLTLGGFQIGGGFRMRF